MDKAAFTKLGFLAGLVKAAGAGDNQPGPMPHQPAPPDSHRKRNVALGAALLAGGILGTRHLARSQSALAATVAKQNRAREGAKILSRVRKGEHAGAEAARWMHNAKSPVGAREKVRALAGHYKQRARNLIEPSRELQNQRFMARHGIKDVSPEGKSRRWSRMKRRAAFAVGAPAVVAGGAVAGASAASRAREPQSDDQPGLGRGPG